MIRFQNSRSVAYGASPRTLTGPPAGTANGDLLLMQVCLTDDVEPTLPAGWTLVPGAEITGTNNIRIYYKIASSEPGSYEITFPSGTGSMVVAGFEVDGEVGDGTIEIDNIATASASGTLTSREFPSVDMTDPHGTMVCFGSFIGNVASNPHAGLFERWDLSGVQSRLYMMSGRIPATGATGVKSASGSSVTAVKAISISLREANPYPVQRVGTSSSTATATASTSKSVTISSLGIQPGDLLLLQVGIASPAVITPPTGFSLVTGASVTNHLYIYQKIADGSEGTALVVNYDTSIASITGVVVLYAASGEELAFTEIAAEDIAADTNRFFPSINHEISKTRLLFSIFAYSNFTFSSPSAIEEIFNVGQTGLGRLFLGEQLMDGMVGETSRQMGTGSGSSAYASITLGLYDPTLTEPDHPVRMRGWSRGTDDPANPLVLSAIADAQEGDLLIVHLTGPPDSVTSPDWTVHTVWDSGSAGYEHHILYKYVTGSEPGTYDFTKLDHTTERLSGTLVALYSPDDLTLVIDAAAHALTTSSNERVWPVVTTTEDLAGLLFFSFTNNAIYTEIRPYVLRVKAGIFIPHAFFTGEAGVAGLIEQHPVTMSTSWINSNVTVAIVPGEVEEPEPPIAPSNLVATVVGSTQIDIVWDDNSSDETGFELETSLNGTDWSYNSTRDANETTYSHTSLVPESLYYYRVRAIRTIGVDVYESEWSNVDSATTDALNPPDAPISLTAMGFSPTQINLSWGDESDNEEGFEIERSPNGSTGWTLIHTTVAGVQSYSNTGLSPDTLYYYRVRSVNSDGESDYTTVESASTLPVFYAPSDLSANPLSPFSVQLTWNDNTDYESGYVIERSLNEGSGFSQIAMVGIGVTTYIDNSLTPNTTYYYRVRGYQE